MKKMYSYGHFLHWPWYKSGEKYYIAIIWMCFYREQNDIVIRQLGPHVLLQLEEAGCAARAFGWIWVWKLAFLGWLSLKSPSPDPSWQRWHQCHPVRPINRGRSLAVGRPSTFSPCCLGSRVFRQQLAGCPFSWPAMCLDTCICCWGSRWDIIGDL